MGERSHLCVYVEQRMAKQPDRSATEYKSWLSRYESIYLVKDPVHGRWFKHLPAILPLIILGESSLYLLCPDEEYISQQERMHIQKHAHFFTVGCNALLPFGIWMMFLGSTKSYPPLAAEYCLLAERSSCWAHQAIRLRVRPM